MARNSYFFVAALLMACGNAANTATPTPVVVAPSASVIMAPAPSACAAPLPKEPDIDLAVGETIELEGTPPPGPTNPAGDAIEMRPYAKNKFLVTARKTGLVTLQFTDGAGASQSQSFRITEVACRKTPLHPAIVLTAGDRAVIEDPDLVSGDSLPQRMPTAATAHFDGKSLQIHAARDGQATILVNKRDQSIALYDVFVGPACADRHYASVVTPIPPGLLGPKGDGTCQRVDSKRVTPVPCPDVSKLDKLPKEAFSDLACEWIGACGRQGDEGCCVGCKNPFRMKVDRGCAVRALRQKTCADVVKIVDAPGCIH